MLQMHDSLYHTIQHGKQLSTDEFVATVILHMQPNCKYTILDPGHTLYLHL